MSKKDPRIFDPIKLGNMETDMWVAYYNHRFARLTWMLFKLNYDLFRPNVFRALRAAYYSAAATIIFRLTKGHEKTEKILKHLTAFTRMLSKNEIQPFDYEKAAKLELEWWFIDRYPEKYSTTRATGLADAIAVRFGMKPSLFREYGQKRAAAMELLGAYHYDPTTKVDWVRLRRYLNESYTALHTVVSK